MPSVWKENKELKKWIKKNYKYLIDGNFNYDLSNVMSDPLLVSISNYIGVNKNYVYIGSGISQFISVIINLNCWDTIYLPDPEFGLYSKTAEANNKKRVKIFCLYCDDFINKIKKYDTKPNDLLCISSPRWFSGEMFTKEQILEIVSIFKGTIMIDEAYVDYSNDEIGMLELCLKNENVILARSFSKKFYASGLRTGYIVTKKNLTNLRGVLIPPYSVTTYSSNFFIKLLSDIDMLELFYNTRQYVIKNRNIVYDMLKDQFNIIKSSSNFLTIIFSSNNELEEAYSALKGLSGIQIFKENIFYIKIWISDEKFSQIVINRLKELK